MTFDVRQDLESILTYGVIAYGLRTFPMPSNKYAKWILGVVQYAFSNPDLAKQNFASQPAVDQSKGETK